MNSACMRSGDESLEVSYCLGAKAIHGCLQRQGIFNNWLLLFWTLFGVKFIQVSLLALGVEALTGSVTDSVSEDCWNEPLLGRKLGLNALNNLD